MCKNCWPPTPEAEATRGPGVNTVDEDDAEDTDVITVGDEAGRLEDDEEVEVEEGEEADAVMETGEDETAVGDVLALLLTKSPKSQTLTFLRIVPQKIWELQTINTCERFPGLVSRGTAGPDFEFL